MKCLFRFPVCALFACLPAVSAPYRAQACRVQEPGTPGLSVVRPDEPGVEYYALAIAPSRLEEIPKYVGTERIAASRIGGLSRASGSGAGGLIASDHWWAGLKAPWGGREDGASQAYVLPLDGVPYDVPEPPTALSLLAGLVGLGGLGVYARRRHVA